MNQVKETMLIRIEWSETQQNWHLDTPPYERDDNPDWSLIAENVTYDVATDFCDWVDEYILYKDDNKIEVSLKEMREYYTLFTQVYDFLKERWQIK